ncbi:hypothetical protein ID866_13181 [Astraeus odoratus]|nr:hypothetical protein ID866_13181 [Astraeus odoratus]
MLATQHGMVITSPNMDFVPDLCHYQDEEVKAHADRRFRLVNPFQWPQPYSACHWWSVAVPCHHSIPHLDIAWYMPSHNDFQLNTGTNVSHLALTIMERFILLDIEINSRCWKFPSKHRHSDMVTFFCQPGAQCPQYLTLAATHIPQHIDYDDYIAMLVPRCLCTF